MVDALTLKGDEGRGMSAISFGEVTGNLWPGDLRMGKPIGLKARYRCSSLRLERTSRKSKVKSRKGKICRANFSNFWLYGLYKLLTWATSEARSDGAYPGKWNISVPGGKENNADVSVGAPIYRRSSYFLSSGERNGKSPNRSFLTAFGTNESKVESQKSKGKNLQSKFFKLLTLWTL